MGPMDRTDSAGNSLRGAARIAVAARTWRLLAPVLAVALLPIALTHSRSAAPEGAFARSDRQVLSDHAAFNPTALHDQPAPAAFETEKSAKADFLMPSFGVLLGLVDSQDAGQAWWHEVAGRNSDLLGVLQPRYYEAARSRDHVLYGLIGGPFDTQAGAAATCSVLQSRSVDCSVAVYRGNRPAAANILSLATPPRPAAQSTRR